MTWLFLLMGLVGFGERARAENTELQWALCETNPEAVLRLLGQEDWKHSVAAITYYEASRPRYLTTGLSFRVKEEGGRRVAVVKARSQGALAQAQEVDCEWDRYGLHEAYACSRSEGLKAGAGPLWAPELRRFGERWANVDWDSLVAFGPYRVDKWHGKWKKRKFALEALRAKYGILELSLRVERAETDSVYREFTDRIERKGVRLCTPQVGKAERLFRGLGIY